MRARGLASLLGALLCIPHLLAGADDTVGSVKVVQGQVTLTRNGQSVPCTEGMHVFTKDVIRADTDGRAGIILRDGTRLSIGPKSELSIEQFAYQPAQQQFGLILRLLRGVAAYVSGKIAEFSPDSVKIETPVGVIGLRGTKLAISLDQP